jgi:hypothetical protein
MPANNTLIVTDLNYETIKNNFKNFVRNKTEFTDYNFEGAVLSRVLDILAYNTYYNSYYQNMIANEMFLDSATLRETVVSRAKELGYFPSSYKSAYIDLNIRFIPGDNPQEIVIPAFSKFLTALDGVRYTFQTLEDYSVINTNQGYIKTIRVFEGTIIKYTFNVVNGNRKFIIPNENLDVSQLKIFVRPSTTATAKDEYVYKDTILDINGNSRVFFVEETTNGEYEISFGDNVMGKTPENGSVIEVTALFSSGSAPNGINTFTSINFNGYNKNNTTVTYAPRIDSIISSAEGGQEKEQIESIKYNAPKYFERQNRIITDEDYKYFILSNYNYVQGVSVWGGETNNPPIFGKTMICVKPKSGFLLSQEQQNDMTETINQYNSLSIDPLFVNPTFTFINPKLVCYYNSDNTILSSDDIFSEIASRVQDYEVKYLGTFDLGFMPSKFIRHIEEADNSIVNTEATYTIEKRIFPVYNTIMSYEINFDKQLLYPYSGFQGVLSSSGFKFAGRDEECFIDDNGYGVLRIYYLTQTLEKKYVSLNAGTVDYTTGKIIVNSISINELSGLDIELRIMVKPATGTYIPKNNEIILLSYPEVSLFNSKVSTIVKTDYIQVIGNESPLYTNSIYLATINV